MHTLSDFDCRRILATIAAQAADPVRATEQAAAFFSAVRSADPDWWQYAANPDLVQALGGQTADTFLKW